MLFYTCLLSYTFQVFPYIWCLALLFSTDFELEIKYDRQGALTVVSSTCSLVFCVYFFLFVFHVFNSLQLSYVRISCFKNKTKVIRNEHFSLQKLEIVVYRAGPPFFQMKGYLK